MLVLLSDSVSGVIFVLTLWSGSKLLLCFGISLFGFMIIPILGIGYTFTAMNCLPISPAASCGIVHILNSVVTLGLNELVAHYLDE